MTTHAKPDTPFPSHLQVLFSPFVILLHIDAKNLSGLMLCSNLP